MTNTNKKWPIVCLSVLALTFGLISCKQTSADIVPSHKFAPYVNAYTGGVISQTSAIRIELTKDVPVVELNSEIKGKPLSFSPSLKGKSYWVSNNTIEFVPDEGELEPGKLYQVTFKLGDYMEVDKELQKFKFSFRVMERNFSIDMKSLYIHASDPDVINIKGEMRFSDVVDKTKLNQMITAKTSDNQSVNIVIDETESPMIYAFTIDNVRKGTHAETIDIVINGKPLGIDNVITKQLKIPAKDCFQFISADLISDPENGIQVIFSEPVATSQNLTGLIEIVGVKTTLQIQSNIVNVFFDSNSSKQLKLNIYAGIQSVSGRKLEENSSRSFSRQAEKPEVKLLSEGTILPDSKKLIIPFKAVSLYAVDLSVIRIYESNVLSFLQINSLKSSNELRRSGRLVYKKMLRLSEDRLKDITRWEDYSIDLSGLIQQEPGAIYRVVLSFKKEYSAYPCDGEEVNQNPTALLTKLESTTDDEESKWDIPQGYYNYENEDYSWYDYEWSERDNPCHASYYMTASRKESCNLLATNLGVLVKRNSGNKLWVAVTNILNTSPMEAIDVTVYNYQLQPIGTSRTDREGFAVIEAKGVPFIVVATDGRQKTYIKVQDGEENSISRFDVGGKEIKKGLKGFIYGERGVWRPGDTLHVSFIMEDHEKRIPEKHPVSIELFNPRGQFYTKQISTSGLNGFYTFHIPTKADDPTGVWNAYVKVGGTSFHKPLRIETVKPNRLKINLQLPDESIKAGEGDVQATLSSSWLTGATASNLKAKMEMKLTKVNTQFKNYTQYIFNNPATDFVSSDTELFDGTLNSEGNASVTIQVPDATDAPGMLRANFTTRVFEPGGDASINTISMPFSPFESYVGINLNQPKNRYIETDQNHVFDVVTVNTDGKPVNRSNLEYKIYRIGWSWWWERNRESFSSYVNSSSITPEATGTIKTVNGKGKFTFRVDYPGWGRYLVYVKDKDSGHATGGTVFFDWPESRGRSNKTDPSGVTMLAFSLDKETYEVGETVTATIPASSDGRALIAIENGSSVMRHEWVQVSAGEDTKFQFRVTSAMAPNVYLHITLLQPHAQTVNDLPIRMYGVMPVFVSNKMTILRPQIKMDDVLRPETEFTVSVSEKDGRPMTYTLAIVDDGLLDLTNFKTPDPWNEFYAREALGIRTWDMFDDVIGAHTGSFSSLFSVGGDEEMKGADAKANRFRPVVKHLGPFTVKKGGSNTHKIRLPMYVGSVRTMVVAGQDGAYGHVEKTTPVRSPLMILSTLPRVLSINEEIWLPVNVFAMESSVKDVAISIETSSNVKLVGGNKQTITFTKTGDQIVYFKAKTGGATGIETVKIKATGGGHSTYETIEIDVRNPNPAVTLSDSKIVEAGKTVELGYRLSNNSKGNWVNLEVARIPSVDFSRRFDYLNSYTHCCTEQLTSKALPLLFVSTFKEIDGIEQERIKKNIQEAIRSLYARQHTDGGFLYWPGNSSANEWVTTYAGVFLLMAKEKGYEVNESVIAKWRTYQRSMAANWTPINRSSEWYYWQSDLQQAYRLYSLALAGVSELGAMNRLKEVKDLSLQAKWRLAAAYAIGGNINIGSEMVFNAQTTVKAYSSNNGIYGSYDRDEAMILETLVLLGKHKEAMLLAKKISENLSAQYYFSTQSTAFSLLAMARLADKLSGSIDIDWSLNGAKQPSVKSMRAIYQAAIPTTPLSGKVVLENKGSGSLYVDLISRTQLINDTLPVVADNLRLNVRYTNLKGALIDISNLKQGTDFKAIVKVENISGISDYQDIALTHIIPSGWEIHNEGLFGGADQNNTNMNHFEYRDIRDDRVLTYFSLRRNQSKEFTIRLQATYAGAFVLPAVQCEAMYDPLVQARTKAGRVAVEK